MASDWRTHREAVTSIVRLVVVRAALDALGGPRSRLLADQQVTDRDPGADKAEWWERLEKRILQGENRLAAHLGPHRGTSSAIEDLDQAVHYFWARAPYGERDASLRSDSIATELRERFKVTVPRSEDLVKASPRQRALPLVEAKVQAQRVLAHQLRREARAETDPKRAHAIGIEAERFDRAADDNVALRERILTSRVGEDQARAVLSNKEEELSLRDLSQWPGIVRDDLPLKRARATDIIAKETSEARRASLATGDGTRPAVAALISRRLATSLAQARGHPLVIEALADPGAWAMDATNEEALAMLRTAARWEHADNGLGELAVWVREEFGLNDRPLGEVLDEAQSRRARQLESGSAEPPSLDDYRDAVDVIGGEMARARRRAIDATRDDPELGPFIRDELTMESARDLNVAQEQAAAAGPLRSAAGASLASVGCVTGGWTGVNWSGSPPALRSLATLDRQVNTEIERRLGREQDAGLGF